MDPKITVQVEARIASLESGLKSAEARVAQSAQAMGSAGTKGGEAFAGNALKSMASIGAVSMVFKRAISDAIDAAKAGESGEEVGTALFRGAVEGAKGVPLVGSLVEILDYAINGAEEAAEARAAEMGKRMAESVATGMASNKAAIDAAEAFAEKVGDIASETDPSGAIDRAAQKKIASLQADFDKQAELEKKNLDDFDKNQAGYADAEAKSRSRTLVMERQLAEAKLQIEEKRLADQKALVDERVAKEQSAADKIAAAEKAATEKAAADRKRADDAAAKERERNYMAEREVKIAALQTASEPSRAEKLANMVEAATAPMVRQADTALGAFKFAEGNVDEAAQLANAQLDRLEAIERLQTEMRDYQRSISRNVGMS